MIKLISDKGRWALRDNSMIFGNIIWESSIESCRKYHLIDDDENDLPFDLESCIVSD